MVKTKQPVLSLGASGTLADTLTYQRGKGVDLVRKKPVPPYSLTLPQRYQRWLYEDYLALWAQQTPAQKQTYRSSGSRFHLTGLQYFMKYHLTHLPDIAGYWKLDDNTGAITVDSSRNTNDLTITGPSPATGRISGNLNFDGLNDRCVVLAPPSLNITGDLSVECFLTAKRDAGDYPVYDVFINKVEQFMLWFVSGQIEGMIYQGGTSLPRCPSGVFVTNGTTYHVALTFDQTDLRIYVNGTLRNTVNNPGGIDARPASPFWLGAQGPVGTRFGDCLLDQVVVYNRVLDQPTIERHSLRRWPL